MTPTSSDKPAPRDWSPHIWQGIEFFSWLRLLWRNRFAVHPRHWHVAAIVTPVSVGHTVCKLYQDALYASRVRETKIEQSPIFILGHWRSGTTLLHEWLNLDERHTFPNTYQCLEPNHFLVTEQFVKRYLGFLMPERRPMDNMAAGWDRPQEDEFALCMMGQPSPYLKIAFPNRPEPFPGSLTLDGLSPRRLADWKANLFRFLQTLTYKDPRRLVLKSPPHTARIRHLLDLFPDAKFVHIMRDPYDVFPSTVNLWKSLWTKHGFQVPNLEGIDEYVYRSFETMYAAFERDKDSIPEGQFHEVRYEDLIADPFSQMRQLYDRLELDEFDEVEPQLKAYLERTKDYTPNRFEVTPEQTQEITRRWGDVIRRYGYSLREA